MTAWLRRVTRTPRMDLAYKAAAKFPLFQNPKAGTLAGMNFPPPTDKQVRVLWLALTGLALAVIAALWLLRLPNWTPPEVRHAREMLRQTGEDKYSDLAGQVHDFADESVADMLVDMDNALIGRHVQELRDIEAARQRLADGNINCCADCGREIGYQRLLAYPMAVRCVACQQQFERTYQHESTPRI